MIFSNHTYNMAKKERCHQPKTHEVSPLTLEVLPMNKFTQLFSDGSDHTEEGKGACATIINMNGKHYTANSGLFSEQCKNSHRIESEGIYLGTKLASCINGEDQEW